MLRLKDCFEKYVELEWGGSVAYKCIKPITQELVLERFGSDSSWYKDVETNAALLRELEDEMLFDGNRWVILLTLGIYFNAVRLADRAKMVYQEARERFPQFQPHEETKRLLGG
jgi:hypothetical protein